MSDQTMPDEVYVWRPENPEPANDLRIRDEPPELVVATRYTRADRIDPAIIAAIDETIEYYEDEFPLDKYPDREKFYTTCHAAGGLKVSQLREIRRVLGGEK